MTEWKPLWDRLLEYYTEEEALRWLCSPQPLLGGKVAAQMLAEQEQHSIDQLHRLLDLLDAGAYIREGQSE